MPGQWEIAFPEFRGTMPCIPDSWQDVSWHNDACPSFVVMQGGNGDSNFQTCRVWIDCVDAQEREIPRNARFMVTYARDGENDICFFMSDSWPEILAYVAIRQFLGAAYVETVGYNPFLDCPEIPPCEVLTNLAWHRFSNGIKG